MFSGEKILKNQYNMRTVNVCREKPKEEHKREENVTYWGGKFVAEF